MRWRASSEVAPSFLRRMRASRWEQPVDEALAGLRTLLVAVVFEAEEPDQGRQGEALEDEGRLDHAEGQEDQEVPLGKGPSPETVSGMTSAASGGAPRIPLQATMEVLRHPGYGSRPRSPEERTRGT